MCVYTLTCSRGSAWLWLAFCLPVSLARDQAQFCPDRLLFCFASPSQCFMPDFM